MLRAFAPIAIAVAQQLAPVPPPQPTPPTNPPSERETLTRYHVSSGEELLAAMLEEARGGNQSAASDIRAALCMPGNYDLRKTLASKVRGLAGLPEELQRIAKGQENLPDGSVKFLKASKGSETENILDVNVKDRSHPCPELFQVIVFQQRLAPGKTFANVAEAGISPRSAVFSGDESEPYILAARDPQQVNLDEVFKTRGALRGEGVVFRIRISVGHTTATMYLDKSTGQVIGTDLKAPGVQKDNYHLIVPFTQWTSATTLQLALATKPTDDQVAVPKTEEAAKAAK